MMIKRLISAVLILAMLAVVPVLLAGCEPKREITIERRRDIEEQPIKREMVVE